MHTQKFCARVNSVSRTMANFNQDFHPYFLITSRKRLIPNQHRQPKLLTLKENTMTNRILTLATAAIVAAVAAGSASAQPVNAGDVQLALQAGVEPGAYSTSQLSRIIEAQSENRTNQVSYVLNEADEGATYMSTSSVPSNPTPTFGTGVNSDNY